MKPSRLFDEHGTPVNVWSCGVCGKFWANKDVAERCCACRVCGGQTDPKKDYTGVHKECHYKRLAERNDKRIAEAVQIEEWNGPVFDDAGGCGDENDYYLDIGSFLDEVDIEEREFPIYVWPCEVVPSVCLKIDRILDSIELLDDDRLLNGCDKLERAIKEFNDDNSGLVHWRPDYKRVIRLDRSDFYSKCFAEEDCENNEEVVGDDD